MEEKQYIWQATHLCSCVCVCAFPEGSEVFPGDRNINLSINHSFKYSTFTVLVGLVQKCSLDLVSSCACYIFWKINIWIPAADFHTKNKQPFYVFVLIAILKKTKKKQNTFILNAAIVNP